jgi:DNA-binding MarR family transcriptional regulator
MAKRNTSKHGKRDDGPEHRLVQGLMRLGLVLRSQAWERGARKGLTPTQGQILLILDRAGHPLRLNQVSATLGVTAATASNAMSALVAKGLVSKLMDTEDRRALRLTLTAEGQRAATDAASWTEVVSKAVGALEPGEQGAFLRGIVRLLHELETGEEIAPQRMCVTCRHFKPRVREVGAPHQCGFYNISLGERDLRVDCSDHGNVTEDVAAATWKRYLTVAP